MHGSARWPAAAAAERGRQLASPGAAAEPAAGTPTKPTPSDLLYPLAWLRPLSEIAGERRGEKGEICTRVERKLRTHANQATVCCRRRRRRVFVGCCENSAPCGAAGQHERRPREEEPKPTWRRRPIGWRSPHAAADNSRRRFASNGRRRSQRGRERGAS